MLQERFQNEIDWDDSVLEEVCLRRHLIFKLLTQTLGSKAVRVWGRYLFFYRFFIILRLNSNNPRTDQTHIP